MIQISIQKSIDIHTGPETVVFSIMQPVGLRERKKYKVLEK